MVSDDDAPAAAVEDYPINFDDWTDDGQFEHIFGRKFFKKFILVFYVSMTVGFFIPFILYFFVLGVTFYF